MIFRNAELTVTNNASQKYLGNFLAYISVAFGIFALLSQIAPSLQLSFKWFSILTIIATPLCTHFIFRLAKIKNGLPIGDSYSIKYLAILIIFSLAVGVIAASTNAPDEDDSIYAPLALQHLENPTKKMGYDLSWIAPFSDESPISNSLSTFSSGLTMFWALLSYVSNVDYLFLYQVCGAFVFGSIFLIVYNYLIAQFVQNEKATLVGTISLIPFIYLLFREDGVGYGITLNKIWIGKSVLFAIYVPLLAGFTLNFLNKPNYFNWLIVFFISVGSTALTTSAIFATPILLFSLALGNAIFCRNQVRILNIKSAIYLLLAAIYPISLGVYIKFFTPVIDSIKASDKSLGGGGDIFLRGFKTFFGDMYSFTTVAVFISIIYLVYQRKAWPLIGWAFVSIILFLNPLTTALVSDYLTSKTAYSRVFYLFPAFAIVGVAIGILVSLPSTIRLRHLGALMVILFLYGISLLMNISCVHHISVFDSKFITLMHDRFMIRTRIDVPKPDLLGPTSFGFPRIRMSQELRDRIGIIQKYLPPGKTLSTLEYTVAMPMITTKYQQYYLWPIPAIVVYGQSQSQVNEVRNREAVANFLNGDLALEEEFSNLLDTDVQNLIISKGAGFNDSRLISTRSIRVREIALFKRFTVVHETPDFVLYSRLLSAN